jgi:hypothetical protein
MDPVPDPLLLRKSGSAGNLSRNSRSVARNSDRLTTEAAYEYAITFNNYKFPSKRCVTFDSEQNEVNIRAWSITNGEEGLELCVAFSAESFIQSI